MIIISPRGNLNGPNPEKENSPDYLKYSIDSGISVEVDLWWKENNFYLGHDKPQFLVSEKFLEEIKNDAWIHCKNLEAVCKLMFTDYHWFWHENDKITLTSKGHVWWYPGYEIKNGIIVDKKQKINFDINILGVCTDYPLDYLI